MVCLRLPGGSWMAALKVMLMALSPPLAQARDTPLNFLHQLIQECHFSNGTERVQYLYRFFYNGQEDLHFDSDVGEFLAVTELGRPIAEHWNSQEGLLEEKWAYVVTLCRHNYMEFERFLVHWQRAQSGSTQSKMLSGAGGFVLGLLFLGAGLLIYFRAQKGHSGLQPTGLLS